MAQSFNSVTLMGRITKKPELKAVGNDMKVCPFSIAVDKQGKTEDVNFFDIVAWGKTAEFVSQYLDKGSLVLVDGRLDQQVWEKDGQRRSAIRVLANTIDNLSPKAKDTTPSTQEVDSANQQNLYDSIPY